MKKLLYIVGMGHSGSTLLDLILGESEDLVSTSQLNDLLAPYLPESESELDAFWRSVLKGLSDNGVELRKENLSIKRERRFFSFLWGGKAVERYAAVNGELLDVLGVLRPESTIVDSSKNVSRALGLLRWNRERVYMLHLVRDVRSYVNSNNLRRNEAGKKKAYLTPALRWHVKNMMAWFGIRHRAKHYHLLRYEDFLQDPERRLAELSAWLGESLNGSIETVVDKKPIHPLRGIVFFGNRILKKEEVVFDPKRSRRDGVFRSRLFWLLLGWPSRLYGYRYAGEGPGGEVTDSG